MKNRWISLVMMLVLVAALVAVFCMPASAENQTVFVEKADQTVDSMTYRGILVKAIFAPYNDIPDYDSNDDYCCAALVHRFYRDVFGIGVGNLQSIWSTPLVTDGAGDFTVTTAPKVGDIIRNNDHVHWAIVKEVKGDTVVVLQQNSWWDKAKTLAWYGAEISIYDSNFTFFRYSGNNDVTAPTIVDNYVFCSDPYNDYDIKIHFLARDDFAITEAYAVVWKYGDTEAQGEKFYGTVGEFRLYRDIDITIDVHLDKLNVTNKEGLFYWKVYLSDGYNPQVYTPDDKENFEDFISLFKVIPGQDSTGNYRVISDAPARVAPYEKWNGKDTKYGRVVKGQALEVVGRYVNKLYNHEWYQLKDGGWIYGEHLKKYTTWMQMQDLFQYYTGQEVYWTNGQVIVPQSISWGGGRYGAAYHMEVGDRHITQPWETPVEDPTGSTAVIYFDANGGYCSKDSYTYDAGAAYGWLPTASNFGEQFLGWYTERSGGTKVTEESICAESGTTLYAHWAPAAQTDGMCGKNVRYALYDGGVLVISGTGDMYDSDPDDDSYSSPFKGNRSIQEVVIEPGVTSVGANAFAWCENLKWATIPEGVTRIGYGAFYECSSLTEAAIPEGVTSIESGAFSDCSSLTEVTIPESVTSIGSNAYYECKNLTKVTMPGTADIAVQKDHSASFDKCPNIQEVILTGHGPMDESQGSLTGIRPWSENDAVKVTIREGLTSICKYAFYDCPGLVRITIPESVTSIGDAAFYRCTGLTELTMPENITSIGSEAFSGCTGLTEMTIPKDVTGIGARAFFGCSGLKEVTISGRAASIGYQAFTNCTGLTKLTISEGVASIGYQAFTNCTGLTELTISEGVTGIESYAFMNCSGLTEVTIPESVTSIGGEAFSGCTGMTKVTLPGTAEQGGEPFKNCTNIQEVILTGHGPMHKSWGASSSEKPEVRPWSQNVAVTVTIRDGLTSICDRAFYKCPGLVQITIPESVTSIGDGAFSGCIGLTEITIPDSVTSIGDSAFCDCVGLTKVTMPGTAEIMATGYTYYEGQTSFYHCPNIQEVILTGHGEMCDSFYSGEGPADRPWEQNSEVTVTIRDGLTSISRYAFSECPGIVRVTIPESVTSIGKNAFSGCSGLTELTIPEGVTSIGEWAFYDCSKMTDVYFGGSQAQWDSIYIGRDNDPLLNATIHFTSPELDITTQPVDYVGKLNSTATFTVAADGDGLTYQWQISDDGENWTNSSVKRAVYTTKLTAARDGRQVRCVVTDANGTKVTSAVATMKLSGPVITTQPKDYTGKLNSTATFTVAAEGNGLAYQWQLSDDNGATWTNSSVKRAAYTSKLTADKDGRQVRCIVTNAEGGKVTSEVATMKLAGPDITTQPKDYTGKLNSTASFSVAATGDGLTYQWQISDDNGATWTNSSVKKAVYTTKLTAERDGRMVRCIVTDANGKQATSAAATMRLAGPVITSQPKNYVGKVNSTASFTVVAEGNGLSYQWQISDNDGDSWTNSSVKKAVYTSKLTTAKDGRMVRCVVTDADGNSVTSNDVTMRIG